MLRCLFICVSFVFNLCFSGHAQNYYELGCKKFYDENNDSVAVVLFSKAIENKQETAKSYTLRAAAKISLNIFGDVTADLEAALKLDSSNYKTYYYYGRFYFVQGFYGLSLKYYNKAIQLNPKSANCYDDRAIARGQKNDFLGALSDEDSAIKINPNNATFYTNRGFAKLNLKHTKDAIKDFTIAIDINGDPKAYTCRGHAYAELKSYEESIKDYNAAIKGMPLANDIPYYLGLSYLEIGKTELACACFSKSVQMGFSPSLEMIKKYCPKN